MPPEPGVVRLDRRGDLIVLVDVGGIRDEAAHDAVGIVQDDAVEERVPPGLIADPVRGEAHLPLVGGADEEVDGHRAAN